MKKILISFLLLIFCIAVWYGESRKFFSSPNGHYITLWRTYNNTCYIIAGKYYGLFKPSLNHAYIETTNTSSGIDLLWKKDSDTILVQADRGNVLYSNSSTKVQLVDYNLNKTFNDSTYTYFDTKLKVKRYKKNIQIMSVTINEMGAL